jgi:hypothetical protein
MSDPIPVHETYRGVGIHAGQPPERVAVVKQAIDEVLALADARTLFDYAGNIAKPPEARLLAAAKAEACFEIAAEERRVRPDIDLDVLRARIAGLGAAKWQDPRFYCSLFDAIPPGGGGVARRETPLK